MIIDVTNEILTKIKTELSTINVIGAYSNTVSNFPCISVEELSNVTFLDTKDSSGENHNSIDLEINIFTNSENKITEAKRIRGQVDSIISESYNMDRTFSEPTPNFLNSDVYRYTMRYSFVIDKNKNIYRG